jgi:hypothetical protein
LISDCQNLAIVDSQNPTGAGVRQHPIADILLAPDAGHQIPAGSGQNGQDLFKLSHRNPTTATGCCRIPAAFAKL